MSHARGRDDAETTRSSPTRTTSDDPLRDSLDELTRLADSLVDGLSDRDDAPPPTAVTDATEVVETTKTATDAAASDKATARSALSETIDQLGQFADPEPPLRSGEPVLEGDRGEDIDAFLDAVLTPDDLDLPEVPSVPAEVEIAAAMDQTVAPTPSVDPAEIEVEPEPATLSPPEVEVVVEMPQPCDAPALETSEPADEFDLQPAAIETPEVPAPVEIAAATSGEAALSFPAIEFDAADERLDEPDGPGDPDDVSPPEYREPDLAALGETRGGGLGWWIAVAIVVAIVALGAWWVMAGGAASPRTAQTTSRPATSPATATTAATTRRAPEPSSETAGIATIPADRLEGDTAGFETLPAEIDPTLEPATPAADGAADEIAAADSPDAVTEPEPAPRPAADRSAATTPRPRRDWTAPPPPVHDPTDRAAAAVEPEPTPQPVAVEPVATTPPPAPTTTRSDTAPSDVTFVPGPVTGPEETLSLQVPPSNPATTAASKTARRDVVETTPTRGSDAKRGDSTIARAVVAPTVVAAPYRPPVVLERREPDYPSRALKRGAVGEVVLRVLVSETGAVVRVVVDDGPDAELEAAAIEAVLHWKYRPARDGGRAVRGWVTERFAFNP